MLRIRLFGDEYIFTEDSLHASGAIALREDYEHGRVSFAQLKSDGRIMRFGELIGTRADIEVLGPSDVSMSDDGFQNIFSGEGWAPPRRV